ncbi:MAG: RDD family protein [Opitutales bacterium]|nr:RDD family protein [Opitutales bacterium]
METVATEAPQPQPAGFWIRVAAYLIDILVLMVPAVASLFIREQGALFVVLMLILLYKPLMEAWKGGTVGKLVLGMRVVAAQDGQRVPFATAMVRNAFFVLAQIPNIILQLKMAEQGVPVFDPEAQEEFMQAFPMVRMAALVFSALAISSCLMVAFNDRRMALHDRMADTRVLRVES